MQLGATIWYVIIENVFRENCAIKTIYFLAIAFFGECYVKCNCHFFIMTYYTVHHIISRVVKKFFDFREIPLPLECEAIASFAVRDKSRLDVPRCRGGGSK